MLFFFLQCNYFPLSYLVHHAPFCSLWENSNFVKYYYPKKIDLVNWSTVVMPSRNVENRNHNTAVQKQFLIKENWLNVEHFPSLDPLKRSGIIPILTSKWSQRKMCKKIRQLAIINFRQKFSWGLGTHLENSLTLPQHDNLYWR